MVDRYRYMVRRFLEVGLILIVTLIVSDFTVEAQEPLQWTPQAQIPDYEVFTEDPPLMIADRNRVIHAFNAQPVDLLAEGSEKAVVYRQWTLKEGWTDPIDILINPDGGYLELMDIYLDQAGIVHLVLEMNFSNIYYTYAPLSLAGQAKAWSKPQLVGEQAVQAGPGIPIVAAIRGDGQDHLAIIYGGSQDGNGLYGVHSADNGLTWSEPEIIYLTYDNDLIVVSPSMSAGQSGKIYAVWSTFQGTGEPGPGSFVSFDPESGQWSAPSDLDSEPGIRTPNVVEYEGQIIVTYYNNNINGNWWRRSQDGGHTWSEPVKFSPRHKGTNGIVSFAVDSNNTLYSFFGERIDDNNHGMWHAIWAGNGWSDALPVVRGPQVKDVKGGKGFDPRSAKAVISNGNVLLVTWGTDGAAGENGAWYSYTTLDVPELPVVALPVPQVTPAATPVPSATPDLVTPTTTPRQIIIANDQPENSSIVTDNPAFPLFIGATPVLLLILIIVVRQLYQYNRR